MAETALAPAPAAPTTAAPVAPEPPSGIQAAMKDFDVSIQPKPKTEPAKAPDAPKDSKVDPAAPAPKGEPEKEDLWSKAPPKLKGEHFKTVRGLEDKARSLENRIKEIESKPREAAGDAKLVEGYQKQIDDLKQRVAASDYRQSDEFQQKYVQRWQNEYKAAVSEIGNLQLTTKDADGNESRRAATEADFQRIQNLPPGEQDQVITALFGPAASRVFSRLFRLGEIQRDAETAIGDHAKNSETIGKEKELASQRERDNYDKTFQQSDADLRKTWKQYFDVDEADPEASESLTKGYEYVDSVLAKAQNLSVEDRAAYNAVIRARAAAMPRLALEKNRLVEENASLKAELKKFRATDPGEQGAARGGAAQKGGDDDIPQGIEAASKALKYQ